MAPLSTTVIGSIPKPKYLNVPCWLKDGEEVKDFVAEYNKAMMEQNSEDFEKQIMRATKEIIDMQENIGLTTITDGEIRREQYIYGFCRSLNGFDFVGTKRKLCRNGAWEGLLPRIASKVSHRGECGFLAQEWKLSQNMSKLPIKVTIPGPMTIIDTFCNDFYDDEQELFKDLVKCINMELMKLAEAGCKLVQVDEPVLVRYPEKAIEYGIDYLSQCIAGLPKDVFKTVHACCGYPTYLDQTDYMKADKDAYLRIASKIDNCGFDGFSIEDAHRRNDAKLFEALKKIKIVLGVIDVVRSRVEAVEEIRDHIREVLQYVPKERLIIAPDCGMILLPMDLAKQKLTNMVKAANSFN